MLELIRLPKMYIIMCLLMGIKCDLWLFKFSKGLKSRFGTCKSASYENHIPAQNS